MKNTSTDIQILQNIIVKFRDERSWKQFHNPKDMSLSLVLEATEVMEHFQWMNKEEMDDYISSHKNEIGKELADVLYWVFLLSYDLNIDIATILREKIKENSQRYPVEKSKGKHTKYTDL